MVERIKPEKIMEELMNYLLASGRLRIKITPKMKVGKVYEVKKKKIDTP